MAIENIDEKAVFNHARNIAAPEEREAYLQQACRHDTEAIGRLRKLLRVYEQEQSFLEAPTIVGAATDPLAPEHPGTGAIMPHPEKFRVFEPSGEQLDGSGNKSASSAQCHGERFD